MSLKELLQEFRDRYCKILEDDWKAKWKDRYHVFDTVFVSDASSCPLKAFFDRFYSAVLPCDTLMFFRQGELWENEAREKMIRIGFPEAGFQQYFETNYRGLRYGAKPDFTSPDKDFIVEIKWTGFRPTTIRDILLRQDRIIARVDGWMADTHFFPEGVYRSGLWGSWLMQVGAYSDFPEIGTLPISSVYIYANRGGRITFRSLDKYGIKDIDLVSLKTIYTERLDVLVDSLKNYSGIMTVSIEPRVEDIKRIWDIITSRPLHYRLISYQCSSCPYMLEGTCPALIPIRGFRYWRPDDIKILEMHGKVLPEVKELLGYFRIWRLIEGKMYGEALGMLKKFPPTFISTLIQLLIDLRDKFWESFKRYRFQ